MPKTTIESPAMHANDDLFAHEPTKNIDTKKVFGFVVPFAVKGFAETNAYVPAIDTHYHFDPDTTIALLAGFAYNRRVMVQGFHGTGKSTHIEQVAARLNWPVLRVNLDSHITRTDLVGRDAIVIRDGKQITEFREGILPWALQRPVALVFDEYDAGRPDVMFVIQRVLEAHGKLTLLDQSRVISPHPQFRLFATANTVGLGDATGLYHGTQPINQGQMDRWNIVTALNFLEESVEVSILQAKVEGLTGSKGKQLAARMVALATLTREGFALGDLSTVMSPRTVLTWAENAHILGDVHRAFKLSFYNKTDEAERPILAEYYQRAFGVELEPVKAA